MNKQPRRCAICGAWTTSTSPRPAYCSPECRRAGARESTPSLIAKLKKAKNESQPR